MILCHFSTLLGGGVPLWMVLRRQWVVVGRCEIFLVGSGLLWTL